MPDGAPGELIVRSETPWTFNLGYDGLPEATARAWRNGWFHTGDILRKDADGNYFFVDRLKDAIRRRGENVSSLEVEAAVRSYSAVDEVIAVGIPAESEEEVMVVIVAEARPDDRAAGADRVAHAAHAVLRGAALRARRRCDPEDRDEQAAEIPVSGSGRHRERGIASPPESSSNARSWRCRSGFSPTLTGWTSPGLSG